jgi:hypothetical protein
MALDCEGNEIVVCSGQDLPESALKFDVAFVNVRYSEHFEGVVPPGEPAAITEFFELSLDKDNENRGHRHERARWLSCGRPHPLTLAKLRRSPRGWRVDRRYRAPVIK